MSKADTYPVTEPHRICQQFRTTSWTAGVMVEILRQYFGSEDRITMERASLLWNPDAAVSKVQIDVVDNLKFAEGDKFPKMLVDIESQEFPHDVLQDLDGYKPETGTIEYTVRNQSAYSIECWGLKKLEASAMGDEVRYFLQTYRHVIAKRYNFNILRPKTFMKPMKYKKFDDYWIGRLIVPFEVHDGWGVTQESLALSGFSLSLNANGTRL